MKPLLTHVAFAARDVDRTIAFYRDHVRLHLVHDRSDHGMRVVWLSERAAAPTLVLVFFHRPVDAAPSTLQHLGFAVESRADVDAAAAKARAEGILEVEPTEAGPIVGYFCIVRDPDGNQVEFSYGQAIDPRAIAERPDGARPEAPHA